MPGGDGDDQAKKSRRDSGGWRMGEAAGFLELTIPHGAELGDLWGPRNVFISYC